MELSFPFMGQIFLPLLFVLITSSVMVDGFLPQQAPTSYRQEPSKHSNNPLHSTMETKTKLPIEDAMTSRFPNWSQDEQKAALDKLLQGSTDPTFDGRHLYGFGNPDHKLSKLQSLTATRMLDYQMYLVRTHIISILSVIGRS